MQNLFLFGKDDFIIILQLFITLFKIFSGAVVKDFDFLAIKFVCITEQRTRLWYFDTDYAT